VSEPDTTYRVIRFYADTSHPDHHKVIATGLSRAEAKAHCQRDETHLVDGVDLGLIDWFDGFEEE
jgi:hypothetical protein